MNLRSFFSALCGIAVLSAGCTKYDPGTAGYTYTFQNNTGKHVNIDVYQSADDFNNNRNVYIHGSADAGSSFQTSSANLHTSTKYYVDWYTDDYVYSNWINRTDIYAMFDPTIIPTSLSNITKMETEPEYARLLCLGGGGTGTVWKAVSGYTFLYNGGGSDSTVLSQLPLKWQSFTLTFHKDYSATYSYIAPDGQPGSVTIICRTAPYGVQLGSTNGNLYFYHNASILDMNGQLNAAGNISYGFTAPFGSPEYALKDTIQVQISGVGTYAMVKTGSL